MTTATATSCPFITLAEKLVPLIREAGELPDTDHAVPGAPTIAARLDQLHAELYAEASNHAVNRGT